MDTPGGTVEVNQFIELDQDVHVQIDIEDELEERYIITTRLTSSRRPMPMKQPSLALRAGTVR